MVNYTDIKNSAFRYERIKLTQTLHIPAGDTPTLNDGDEGPGALWFKTPENILMGWTGTEWVEVGGPGGGDSSEYKEGVYKTGDTVKIDQYRRIEFINEPFAGSSIPSGWTNVGSPTTSYSGGKVNFSGSPNNWTTGLRSNKGVLSEQCIMECDVTINAVGANDYGVFIGYKSYNINGYQHSVYAGYVSDAGDANYGKILIYGTTGSSFNYSTADEVAAAGDTLRYRFIRDQLKYILIVTNLNPATPWILYKEIQVDPLGSPFGAHNSAYPTILHRGGNISADNFKYTIIAPNITDMSLIGDSITFGQSATGELLRFANMVGIPMFNIISGGGADTTQEVRLRIDEIIATKPRRALLMIGGNNVLFGGASEAAREDDYIFISDSLRDAGIEVIHLYPTARTATDIRSHRDFIRDEPALAGDRKIDTFTVTWSGSGFSMAADINVDNTHFNNLGHARCANKINQDLKFPVATSILNQTTVQADSNFYISSWGRANGYMAGQDAGTGKDQAKSGGLIAFMNGTSSRYVQIGYLAGFGWIQPIHEANAYENLQLCPAGGSVIVGESTSPHGKLYVRTVTPNTHVGMALNHGGSYSEAGQEFQFDFENGGTPISRIANYAEGGTKAGLKLYSADIVINTVPALTLTGGNEVGINQPTPHASSLLDMASTTKGSLPYPRMTTSQRNAISSPATGLTVFDTTVNKVSVYNGTAWIYLGYELSGLIHRNSSTVSNDGTNVTTLSTYTTLANRLAANDEEIRFEYEGTSNDTSPVLEVKFAGTAIATFNAGPSATPWKVSGKIVRTGSGTATAYTEIRANGISTPSINFMTGLTFSGTNVLLLTGTSTGGAVDSIVKALARVYWESGATI